jgi:hypothetical protein
MSSTGSLKDVCHPNKEYEMGTIIRYGEGKCVWCCQTTEGVEATFKDGLKGFLCKKDFWAAVKARSELKESNDAEGLDSRKSA